jgi:myosin heavy subunit
VKEFKYLNQSKTMTIDGVSDATQFEITKVGRERREKRGQ